MNFLQTISGTKYETQTSAALNYLLINSSVFRKYFVNLIASHFASTNIPTFSRGIRCYCEHGDSKIGFVDVVIECDNLVIGIENKLWAGFQENQPSKYGGMLEAIAETQIQDKSAYRVCVLAPSQRTSEIREHLATQKFAAEPIVIHWQDIQMLVLTEVQRHDSQQNAVIAEMLSEFLDLEIGKYADMNIPKRKVIGDDAKITNPFHEEFLYRIKSSFADHNPSRMGKGKGTYTGFYFHFDGSTLENWFGFHSSDQGTILQIHAGLNGDPPVPPKNWQMEKKGDKHYFTFDAHKFWPVTRIEWMEQIDQILSYLIQYTEIELLEKLDTTEGNK